MYESSRLFRMIGVGADVLRPFGSVVLATAALSLFIALYHALNERAYDIAVLRTLGARPSTIAAAMLMLEALMLSVLGGITGIVLAHGLVALLAWWTASQDSLTVSAVCILVGRAVVAGPALLLSPRFFRLARGKGGHFRDARAPPLNREGAIGRDSPRGRIG